jgi:hypothetical protein
VRHLGGSGSWLRDKKERKVELCAAVLTWEIWADGDFVNHNHCHGSGNSLWMEVKW